jgi:hypothetical protein
MIVWPLVAIVVLMVAWLWAGRPLSLFVDRLMPFPVRSLPVSPLSYHGSGWLVGEQDLTFALLNNLMSNLELTTDSANQVILSCGRDAFVLGPRTTPVNLNGPVRIDFVPGSGDQLRLAAHESLLGWPNPFEISWLGGSVARWKKYVYYQLVWNKPSGARLEMRWRYERNYYQRTGWTEPLMMWNSQTGLVSVDIALESKGPEGAVVRYIARTKGWNRSQYWIERRGPSEDGLAEVFSVIRLCDACRAEPGPGGSVKLYVDRARAEVTRERN